MSLLYAAAFVAASTVGVYLLVRLINDYLDERERRSRTKDGPRWR